MTIPPTYPGEGFQLELFPSVSPENKESKSTACGSGKASGEVSDEREERRQQRNAAERQRKRRAGEVKMSREEYLQRAAYRREEAVRHNEEGLSAKETAYRLGLTTRRVRQLLRRG